MVKRIFISFDIDGTMLICKGNLKHHMEAFREAISEYFGPCDTPEEFLGYCVDGWMDKKIVRTMLEKKGVETSDENINKVMNRMEELFERDAIEKPIVIKGIERILSELSQMENVTIGVASGNLPRIAWHKLSQAGIIHFFPERIGGFGVVNDRPEAVANALKLAKQIKNQEFDVVFHVGDTPSDINAANQTGAISIGVKTGRVNYDNLHDATILFEDLEQCHDQFFSFINSQ